MNVALARKRHESFCLHYMSTLNGSQSALAAGYCARNPKNAHITAWTLLKREDVQARLKDYQDSNGKFRPLDDDTPNPSAIAEVTYGWDPVKREAYPIRIRLHDAIDAIAELCRLDGSYKKPSASVTVAPMTSGTVQSARAKLAASLDKLSARITEAEDVPGKQEETSGKASR